MEKNNKSKFQKNKDYSPVGTISIAGARNLSFIKNIAGNYIRKITLNKKEISSSKKHSNIITSRRSGKIKLFKSSLSNYFKQYI